MSHTRTTVEPPRHVITISMTDPLAAADVIDCATLADAQTEIDDPVGSKVLRLPRSASPMIGQLVPKERDPGAWTGITYQGAKLTPRQRHPPSRFLSTLHLPVIQANPGQPAVLTSNDGVPARYVFDGVGFKGDGSATAGIVELGGGIKQVRSRDFPQRFWFNQCCIWQEASANYRAGITAHVHGLEIGWSWVQGIKHSSNPDAQALRIFDGPGVLNSHHNFYEGAGEIWATGGSDPLASVPLIGDVRSFADHFYKRPSWKDAAGIYIKNGVEFKQGGRIDFAYGIIENGWVGLQPDGAAFVPWSVNQDGTRPDMLSCDLAMRKMWFRNVCQVAAIVNKYWATASNTSRRIEISDTVTTGLDTRVSVNGKRGRCIRVDDGGTPHLSDLIVERNLALVPAGTDYPIWMQTAAVGMPRTRIRDNVGGLVSPSGWIFSNAAGIGQPGWNTVNADGSGAFEGNVLVGTYGRVNPTINTYLATVAALGLVNSATAFDVNATLAQLANLKPGIGSPATGKGPDIDDIIATMAANGLPTNPADLPQ